MAVETLFATLVAISPENNLTSEKHGLQCYGSEQYHDFQIYLFYKVAPTLRLKPNLLHIEPGLKESPRVFVIILPNKNLPNANAKTYNWRQKLSQNYSVLKRQD